MTTETGRKLLRGRLDAAETIRQWMLDPTLEGGEYSSLHHARTHLLSDIPHYPGVKEDLRWITPMSLQERMESKR